MLDTIGKTAHVSLGTDTKDLLQRMCDDMQMNQSQVVRLALAYFYNKGGFEQWRVNGRDLKSE